MVKTNKDERRERLSKLQKWILKKYYEQGEKRGYGMWRRELARKYYQEVKRGMYSTRNSQVTLTRSIRNLAFKDYIDVAGGKTKPVIDLTDVLSDEQKTGLLTGKNIKMFWLTDKGKAETEKLLNVKK